MEKRKVAIELTPEELEVSKFVLGDKKRVAILRKLMQSDLYFNQICKGGGSRSLIADTLEELVAKGILTADWEVRTNTPVANPAPYKAVKMFHIVDKYRRVIEKLRL